MASQGAQLNDIVKPVEWLLGKWRGTGQGKYPTMKDFSYTQEVEFSHIGQPNLQFSSDTWHVESKKPLHREVGFLRIQPGTNKVALLIAQNIGLSEIEEGEVTGQSITLTSHTMGRLTFGKSPVTKKLRREFRREGDSLVQIVAMETENTAMTEHLRIKYDRVE